METSRLSSKGQVVVPQAVRRALQAEPGAEIGFEIQGDRAVLFIIRKKAARPGDGFGLLKDKGRKVALKDWDKALAEGMRRTRARR